MLEIITMKAKRKRSKQSHSADITMHGTSHFTRLPFEGPGKVSEHEKAQTKEDYYERKECTPCNRQKQRVKASGTPGVGKPVACARCIYRCQ